MKRLLIIISLGVLLSCNSKSQISKDLNCKPETYTNLEWVEDVDKKFRMKLPKNWKTNLYFDRNQTSIFSADTTKNLTETYTVDITYIYNQLHLNNQFIQRFKADLQIKQLVETTSYELEFQEKPSYYSRALGKRGQFDYQICNLFIKIDEGNYIHAKAQVYGNDRVNERICNALSLIEQIQY